MNDVSYWYTIYIGDKRQITTGNKAAVKEFLTASKNKSRYTVCTQITRGKNTCYESAPGGRWWVAN